MSDRIHWWDGSPCTHPPLTKVGGSVRCAEGREVVIGDPDDMSTWRQPPAVSERKRKQLRQLNVALRKFRSPSQTPDRRGSDDLTAR